MKKLRSTIIIIILIFFISSCDLFIEKTKTVIFESNGAAPIEAQILAEGSPIVAPAVPVKEHYIFNGWYSDAALTAPWNFTTLVSTEITLYANWALKNYKITYHFDNGASSAGNPESYTIETTTITFQEPTKIGHTFEGWFSDSGFTTEITGIGAAETGDKDVYMKWAANEYTVTLNNQEGTGGTGEITAAYGKAMPSVSVTAPTKTGYIFSGYYDDSNGTGIKYYNADMSSVHVWDKTAAATLHAKWAYGTGTIYKIEHYQQNIVGNEYPLVTTDTEELTGTTGSNQAAPARSYTGFKENKTHLERKASGVIAADGSLVLKLYYDRNTFSVSFEEDGGSSVSDITDVRYGAFIDKPTDPTKTGYNFAGWYTESSTTNSWIFASDTITDTKTLYAEWTNTTYTLSYDANGGIGDMTSEDIIFDTTRKLSENIFSRVEYNFQGWASTATGSVEYEDKANITGIANDVRLFAVWEPKSYEITYHLDSGVNAVGNPNTYTIETATITFLEPTKFGYTFEGWFTDSGFNTEIQGIGAAETGDRDIYAKWLVWTSAASFIIKETHTGTEIEIVDFIGLEIEVCIPDSIGGKPVTSIGESAFSKSTSLESVTIGNNITSIDDHVFNKCTSLTSISFGSQITSISKYAFSGCTSLERFTINNRITTIDTGAFSECTNLESITFGNSITTIGIRAFQDCTSLTSISIPDSVTSIGDSAFYDCTNLESITLGNSVTSIGDAAFYKCISLAGITIGNSVTSIGNYTFSECTSLGSITLGNSITSIGDRVFEYCTSLTNITIPDSVTTIGDKAFIGCSGLTSITIPGRLTSIGDYAFFQCTSLKSLTLGISVTSIGDYAFSECTGLTSITFPESLTSLGKEAYKDCIGLISITFVDCSVSIDDKAFFGCTSLKSITFGNSAASIGDSVFSGCVGLTSITIPNRLTSIGDAAFFQCTSLKNLTIGTSVTSIGVEAFSGCTDLTAVTLANCAASIKDKAFFGCNSLENITFGNSITSIGDRAFNGCNRLTIITIPDSVTSIGEAAFAVCTSIKSLTIGNGVTSIGESAFALCNGITNLTMGNSVTSIEYKAFSGCTGLTSIMLPESLTSIGSGAFNWCSKLISITIPSKVITIGAKAFDSCRGLTSIKCAAPSKPLLWDNTWLGNTNSDIVTWSN